MRRISLCVLIVLLWAGAAYADGMMVPEPGASAMPVVGSQQAVIAFRDGVETLIIRPTYHTDSQTVGWVLPLPAEPTELTVAHAGMFPSLVASLQPNVKYSLRHWRAVPAAVLTILLPLSLIVLFGRDAKARRRLALLWLASLIIAGGLIAFVRSAASGSDDAIAFRVSRVREVAARRIGHYDVRILQADDASALDRWLSENGLAELSDQARAVAADYVAKGWCFAVATLRQDGRGLARPHPIAATFRTPRPVYPVRLTALADSDVQVELVVIADGRARAPGLRPVIADRFGPADFEGRSGGLLPEPYFVGESRRHLVGHPDVTELMWPGCVVTRLAGRLGPDDMAEDLVVDLTPLTKPVIRTFYTARSKRQAMIAVIAAAWGGIMVVLAVLHRRRQHVTRRQRRVVLALLVGIVSAVIVSGLVLPITPVRTVRLIPFKRSVAPFHLPAVAQLAAMGQLHAAMTDEQLADYPDILRTTDPPEGYEGLWRILVRDRLDFQRSPGNFHVRRDESGVSLCFYDQLGREYRFRLPVLPR